MNRYGNTVFPDYEYREYPKWVTPEGSAPVIVNDEDEEAEVMATKQAPIREADERERLLKIAEINGVQVDKRWKLDKIEAAITDAGHDASVNPFE